MSVKEAQETIIANMQKWQKIEKASVNSTQKIIDASDNPVVKLVAEIIQNDSKQHEKVQAFIESTLDTAAVTLSPDELGKVWNLIEKHIEIEKETVSLAKESLAAIEGVKGMTVQAYLIEYLLKDEQKHDEILANLEQIKKNMYPYG
jgi:rubrerythrin